MIETGKQRVTEPDQVRWDDHGLVPAVIRERAGGAVLMLAYMDREALTRTLATGETWFWSRSRQTYWHKGETSGHVQRVLAVWADCDQDALLVEVLQVGPACHTGEHSCFHNPLTDPGAAPVGAAEGARDPLAVLAELEAVIESRKAAPRGSSYTSRLLSKAPDAICKKVGEEATEVVLASKNSDLQNLVWEVADLWYHTLVLLHHHGLSSREVATELARRRH
ncbi:MAG: bifunctional phosphoribosyl-AMP cyclohydrolase/phosphoribosyl-ATP diphosphatase HisIE [Symbiobacteriia bacterium]